MIMELSKSRTAEINVEVVWSAASGADDESKPGGMGVRFLWLEENLLRRLSICGYPGFSQYFVPSSTTQNAGLVVLYAVTQ